MVDRALAGVFLAAMAVERLGAASRLGGRLPPALALSAVIAGALAVRRTAPLAGYLVGSAALSAEALFLLPSPVSPYANLIGLYALGLYGTRQRARLGPVVVLLGMVAYFTGTARTYPVIPAGVLFVWLLAWALGYTGARRQEEREAARLLLRRQVAAEERARIARELHDLVGHTLTVLLVQAGAARRLLGRDPQQTGELLSGMEHTGREALDELDRVLGLLRHGGPALPGGEQAEQAESDGADLAAAAAAPGPQPGLRDLDRLSGQLARAGVRVSARIDPAVEGIPRSIDLSAYRIVQEGLTNAVKHGRADAVELTVHRDGEVLDIEVSDDGRGVAGGYLPGRGLLGITERVAMFGGSVAHGGGERGGFRLHVRLPVPR
ncbi:sensor histidine kinase [Kitasatospora sp. NBC_01266]|uniref:sensor histidine kinase n=1 Tax=Kitasatospora sp. NBC_01266 TaxID=2903572 RepID=UPI002E339792|nr:histidine kinase [Kitasatospora sp. NBC_01266]